MNDTIEVLMVDVWITAGNLDPREIVNPFYAAYNQEVYPNQLHILTPENTAKSVERAIPVIEQLVEGEGKTLEIERHEASSTPSEYLEQSGALFEEFAESVIALDITGRPSMYATLLVQRAVSDDAPVNHIYHLTYEHSSDTVDNELYPLIPQTTFSLIDILAEYQTEASDD